MAESPYVSIDEPDPERGSGTPDFVPQQRHQMFLILCATSMLEMVAAASACANAADCQGASAWAIALGLVSACACGLYLYTANTRPQLAESVLEPVSLSLFWWWVAGVCTTTFYGPFLAVGNGYCAAWATLVVSTVLLYGSSTAFRGTLDEAWSRMNHSVHVELLAVASTIVVVAAGTSCAASEKCDDGSSWGIFVGALSLFVCGAGWCTASGAELRAHDTFSVRSPTFALLMAGWWMLAVCTLTMSAPFAEAGNGFFATWLGLYASIHLVFTSFELAVPAMPSVSGGSAHIAAAPRPPSATYREGLAAAAATARYVSPPPPAPIYPSPIGVGSIASLPPMHVNAQPLACAAGSAPASVGPASRPASTGASSSPVKPRAAPAKPSVQRGTQEVASGEHEQETLLNATGVDDDDETGEGSL
jgi:hypothetical protein